METRRRPTTYLSVKGAYPVTAESPCRYCGSALREHVITSTRPLRRGCPDTYDANGVWKGWRR